MVRTKTLFPLSLGHWRDYYELCKPRVVLLMLITSMVGMCLATPHWVPLSTLIGANLGIGAIASTAAAINHLADQHIDRLMGRTQHRPLAQERVTVQQVLCFAALLCGVGTFLLLHYANSLTLWLTLASLVGYAGIYTLLLKHVTPQNIVIGGLAGAVPPLLGWTAVTGTIHPHALLLVLIIFVWTPPHFWALAIARHEDYAKAAVPMLPNTHSIPYTKWQILLYTLLLSVVTLLPVLTSMATIAYGAATTVLNLRFLYLVWHLYRDEQSQRAMETFWYSILYLGLLFLVLLLDHYYLMGVH